MRTFRGARVDGLPGVTDGRMSWRQSCLPPVDSAGNQGLQWTSHPFRAPRLQAQLRLLGAPSNPECRLIRHPGLTGWLTLPVAPRQNGGASDGPFLGTGRVNGNVRGRDRHGRVGEGTLHGELRDGIRGLERHG